jgi:hypothetical protein
MVRVAGLHHARGVDLVDPTLIEVVPDPPSGRRRRRLVLWLAAAMAAFGAMLVVGDDIGGW